MPSLKQLEQFQRLMGVIGGQDASLAEEGREPEKFRLPDNEPEPPAAEAAPYQIEPAPVEGGADSAAASGAAAPGAAEEAATGGPPPVDFSDFGAFVDAQPPDSPEPDASFAPEAQTPPEAAPPGQTAAADEAPFDLDGFGAAADETPSNLDGFDTAADEAPFDLDGVDTAADEALSNLDGFGAAADEAPFDLDGFDTAADEALSNLDGVDTAADEALSNLDGVDTAADEAPFDLDGFDAAADEAPDAGAPPQEPQDAPLSGVPAPEDIFPAPAEPDGADGMPAEQAGREPAPAADETDFNLDDFNVPEGAPDAETPSDSADGDFNLDGFGFDGGAEGGADSAPEESESALPFDDMDMSGFGGDTGLSGAPPGDDFGAVELGGAESEPPVLDELEDDDIPSITDTEVSEEEKDTLLSGRRNREESAETEEPDVLADAVSSEEDSSVDRFDAFDFNTDSKGGDNTLPDLDDFNFAGTGDAPAPKAKAEEKPEELRLTEDQLAALLDTLSNYPLNVRVACEEIIAEQIIPPAQLSALTKLLINRGSASEAARLAGKILGRRVPLPKGYKTGEALEEEQQSFAYIFFHKFFPVIRLFVLIALIAACASYLCWHFVINPLIAESLYKKGYELIAQGDPNEYQRANQYFNTAFDKHRVKTWFYKYAQRFREEKQYLYAREKFDALLFYYPHDKQGALLYADMEAYDQHNYEKADKLIRNEVLDYRIDDKDGLLALGDVNLAWAEVEPSRYEEARTAYARLLAFYGYTDQILERMLLYFIRTDKLFEVLPLQQRFMGNPKSKISAPTLAELGGYLLDKRLEVPDGVPDEDIERIEGIKDILIRAATAAPALPEPDYHLARYYNFYGALVEERFTLQAAAAAFDLAPEETAKRTGYRIDTQERLASLMTKNREFILAERELIKAVNIYEDAVNRGLLSRKPQFGKLYADLGDLEYFAKEGALDAAERYYVQAETNGWMPPDIQYRLGNTYYRRGAYPEALTRFFNVAREFPLNRRLLFALGNTSYENADYFTAQAYYKMLLDLLNAEKSHISKTLPDGSPEHNDLIERLMMAQNNMGVTLNALGTRTGRPEFRPQALVMFAEAIRGWDALERDQITMLRPSFLELRLPGAGRPYLNMQHALYPTQGTEPQIFAGIDADVLEPSEWDILMGR